MRLFCVIIVTLSLPLLAASAEIRSTDSTASALHDRQPYSAMALGRCDFDRDGTIELIAITCERCVAGRPVGGEKEGTIPRKPGKRISSG